MVLSSAASRARNRTARWVTEILQPPVVVTIQLLVGPAAEASILAGLLMLGAAWSLVP